ncbi:hypothetical protein [Brachybacterium sp. GU-2]|uniref:hypothetical protein n=1 Tax=Brachybacterium sp. GU-2 TaxID=3069708 RepID=UPI00280AC9F0|nr:hypothetical protein [Brachybacterium sp. GU-2]WME24434.1 hypothetical protein RBL05_06970 [Brachybacterium sp. GU-2]
MASLIESVRKLHGPTLVAHDNGYDVDVICLECTRLRTDALEKVTSDGEDWSYAPELANVPYPCPTRIVAGTTEAEGQDESARMRLESLVVQREHLEERMERLDAVIALIRRDLGEETSPAPEASSEEGDAAPAPTEAVEEPAETPTAEPIEASEDGYDF